MAAPGTNTEKYIACAAIVPDCPFEATAPTEEELMKMVAAHAAHTHGIREVSPELAAKVKAAIEERQFD
jgi:predicted small metal-binding protein